MPCLVICNLSTDIPWVWPEKKGQGLGVSPGKSSPVLNYMFYFELFESEINGVPFIKEQQASMYHRKIILKLRKRGKEKSLDVMDHSNFCTMTTPTSFTDPPAFLHVVVS